MIKWVSDSKQFGFREHWDFPAEVLHRKKADCEGQAHLLVSLLRNAGIPAYRLKVAIGWARSGRRGKWFYHAYGIYLREIDGNE